MFLTGKEDKKKENIDSILNMSFKLHSSIDQSIGEFQETRKGRGVKHIRILAAARKLTFLLK